MNDKTLQELVLKTMQSNSETLAIVSQDVVEVRTITQGVSDRLKKVEEKSHSAPCAHVQTLREKICTSTRLIKWFVALIVVLITSFVGYVLANP
ncbi:MAG: hypothetical protein ACYTDW_20525 [Planctomycetota bacterium]|jgi:hypothetical protein